MFDYKNNVDSSAYSKNEDLRFKNGDFKLHILNENNVLITAKFIEDTLKKYGLKHKVKNLELFQTAMIHISYMNRTTITEKTAKLLKDVEPIDLNKVDLALPLQTSSYGTLEYLGDAVIHDAIADYLFDRYNELNDEGFLTKIRTKLEKADTLSELSKRLGLHKYAVIARNVEAKGRLNNVHLTEDLFESFFGALSKEISREKCFKVIINIIEKEIDIAELIYNDDNYKDRLMQHFHKLKWSEPVYNEDTTKQNDSSDTPKVFSMYVADPSGTIIGVGEGLAKGKAEQNAAKSALVTLEVIKENVDCNENDYYGEMSDDEDLDDLYILSDDDT